jgi:uroporphyrinogen decarboxylase
MADYPVQVFHWDSHAGHNPGFARGRSLVGRAVGGGVDARTLAMGSPEDVRDKACAAVREVDGKGFVLGPGCSVQVAQTSHANLQALRRAADFA